MALIDTGKLKPEYIIPRSEQARAWRNAELKATDWIIPITDHPERDATLLYRVALRGWPSTDSFPLTKPIK